MKTLEIKFVNKIPKFLLIKNASGELIKAYGENGQIVYA